MPPMLQKWYSLSDDDKNLFPLLEVKPAALINECGFNLHTHVQYLYCIMYCTCTYVVHYIIISSLYRLFINNT